MDSEKIYVRYFELNKQEFSTIRYFFKEQKVIYPLLTQFQIGDSVPSAKNQPNDCRLLEPWEIVKYKLLGYL